jgi:hypothetical protein
MLQDTQVKIILKIRVIYFTITYKIQPQIEKFLCHANYQHNAKWIWQIQ